MGEKKSFVLHKDYNNQIKKLSDEDAAALLRAIFAYVNGEEVCELSPVADMVFSFITAQIDRDNAKYKAKCEKNKANGKKGGRPKQGETEENPKEPNETERFSEKPKKADNDNDNDNDSDNDNDNDNDSGSDIKSRAKSSRFTPPTLEEVKEYCLERQNNVDAQRFVDFYESKGWMVGKNKMKDWKAAVRNWERTEQSSAPRPPNQNKQGRLDWIDDI